MATEKHFEIRLHHSGLGRKPAQRATLKGLGLTRVGKTVYLKDTPAIRGMIYQVVHLVQVTPKTGAPPPSHREQNKAGTAKVKRPKASKAEKEARS